MITPQTLKGFRDFQPDEAAKRQYVIDKIRSVFQVYGFQPIETPALEYLETFTGNIGEDEKLFFKFEDQGGRRVALRYDQTVPTCRYIAQYRDKLVFPFKRYQIQPVWRAEKPQKGRYREFIQCDADIFGVEGYEADAEIIALTLDIYKTLGFKDYIVKINDRSLFSDVPYEVIVAIDKLAKIGKEKVIEEIVSKGMSTADATAKLDQILNAKPTETVTKISSYLESLGFDQAHYVFDPSIARSFNYSTGPIWEVVIPGYSGGSVLGGERYDKLIGRFQKQDIPATGFAVGFDRTYEAMVELGILKDVPSAATVLVTVFEQTLLKKSLEMVAMLRDQHIRSELYATLGAKLDKQLKYADKKAIAFALIIGPDEAQNGMVKLKNMQTGQQVTINAQEVAAYITSRT